jgi:hypothetical protein
LQEKLKLEVSTPIASQTLVQQRGGECAKATVGGFNDLWSSGTFSKSAETLFSMGAFGDAANFNTLKCSGSGSGLLQGY